MNNMNMNNNMEHDGQFIKTSPSCPNPEATKLIITNIPIQSNDEEHIKEHFSKFGTIVSIQKLSTAKSMVEFSNNAEANKAMKSPEAIMNNRFIKLFWEDTFDGKKTKFEENQEKQERIQKQKEEKEQQLLKIREQLLQKRLEAMKKQTEQKKELTQVSKNREELRKQQLELQKQLILKLEATKDEKEKESIKESIKALTKSITESLQKDHTIVASTVAQSSSLPPSIVQPSIIPPIIKPSISINPTLSPPTTTLPSTTETTTTTNTNLEQLKNTLKAFETQAQNLGISASTIENTQVPVVGGTKVISPPSAQPASVVLQQQQNKFSPKKPAITTPPRKSNSLVIDNRTTTVKISDPPTEFKNESLLKQLFPDIVNVSNTPDQNSIQIQFGKRVSAERFFVVAKTFKGKELLMSWVEKQQSTPMEIEPSSKIVENDTDVIIHVNNNNNQEEEDDEDDEEGDERSWKH